MALIHYTLRLHPNLGRFRRLDTYGRPNRLDGAGAGLSKGLGRRSIEMQEPLKNEDGCIGVPEGSDTASLVCMNKTKRKYFLQHDS